MHNEKPAAKQRQAFCDDNNYRAALLSIQIAQSKETTRGNRSQLWFFGPSREIRCRCAFGHIVRCCRHRAGGKQQSTGLAGDLSRLVFPGCIAPKPPLCKGRWAAERRLGGVDNPSVKNQRFLPAPFTQRSLFSVVQHSTTPPALPVVSKCALMYLIRKIDLSHKSTIFYIYHHLITNVSIDYQSCHWKQPKNNRLLPIYSNSK